MAQPPGDLIIVTGMTGAGRSTAAKALEDLGWFVIDNLPPQLLQTVLQLIGDEEDSPTGSQSWSTCDRADSSPICAGR